MRGSKGLTLIELLVAMSILTLIVSILYSVFNISLSAWRKADNMLEAAQIARVVLERMSREISSAIVREPKDKFFCLGFSASAPSGYRPASNAAEFYFIAPLKPDYAQGSDLCEVGYWLDGNGSLTKNDDVLKRFYVTDDRKEDPADPEFDFDFSTGDSDEFSSSITNLDFKYYDGSGNEYAVWDSRSTGIAPAKIKITITVEVGKGSKLTNQNFFSHDFNMVVSLR